MIKIKPEDIKNSGGLLAAISNAAVNVARASLRGFKSNKILGLSRVRQLLTHKNPHLDEYMAIYLFKAALPEHYSKLPLDEFVLHSANNDGTARATWPESAVFGLGGVHDGGARAAVLIDEHTAIDKVKKDTSAVKIIKQLLFSETLLRPEVGWLLDEVDHIDSHANAHTKHLGNYIKKLHDAEFALSKPGSTLISEGLTPQWKQAIVEACFAAVILGIREKKQFKKRDYWVEPARASLQDYRERTLLRHQSGFDAAWKKLNDFVNRFNGDTLKIRKSDGSIVNKLNNNGSPIPQQMCLPYLAGLCQEYWGPELGQLILAHFWETRILSLLDFDTVQAEAKKIIGSGDQNKISNTSAGLMEFKRCSIMFPDQNGVMRAPWIIEINMNGAIKEIKSPLMNLINNDNGGVGFILIKDQRRGTIGLNKSFGIPQESWENLIKSLIAREGTSDDDTGGSWHITENAEGLAAPFLLNGNAAHQYSPRSSLNASLLADFVDGRLK